MAQRQKRDGTFSYAAKQSTDSITRFRFVVFGSDEVLINEACDIILRSADRMNSTKHGTCEFREACVSGRHVSVVKSPAYQLEHLKMYLSFSRNRSIKRDMELCYSLVFPGPHAFLLVLGDVRNSGKEHYILQVLSDVFGQEALDYSMVLFMHEYRDSDISRNVCVRKCRKRFHILKNNEENVLKLFHDTTETMIKQRKGSFFTKHFDLLDKTEAYFKVEFDAKYEERESTLKGNLEEMKTSEENLRTKMTEMEKRNSENTRELQDLHKELDAHKTREIQLRMELDASISRENRLSQQIDALKKKKYELKEELYALRYYKRQLNEELTAFNEREREEFLLTKIQLQRNRLQEQKEVGLQASAQKVHDRQKPLDRREVELDESERKLLQTTGSQHGDHISTAGPLSRVSEDKLKPQEDTGSLEFEGLKLVRQNNKKSDPLDMCESKIKPLSERECEMESEIADSQSSRSLKGEGLKPVRQNSNLQDRPSMSEDKLKPQEDTGYLEFERLQLVEQKKLSNSISGL
ncbi:protein Hook homolog 3-like isoform X2 [Labeo rohita]|uniref:protein Hook homolog 3-like isoform X2 n=1 Tax=Labeo rohita TaxID=84645 RepID=UPI0021E2CBDD|nr:protein Hook homolog 3-like isoform X2 [Labeo rohita]